MWEGLQELLAGSPLWIALVVLLPVLGFVLLAAGARVWLARRGVSLPDPFRRVSRSSLGWSLDDLTRLARDYYKAQGYEVVADVAPGERASEMVVFKETQRTLVRCVLGNEPPGPEAVTEMAAERDKLRAQRAVLIAPAGFLSSARRRAVSLGVELRDKTQIELMRTMAERRAF